MRYSEACVVVATLISTTSPVVGAQQHLRTRRAENFWGGSPLISVNSGNCVDPILDSISEDSPLVTANCDKVQQPRPEFSFHTIDDNGNFQIVHERSLLCFGLYKGTKEADTPIVLAPCDGAPEHTLWRIRGEGSVENAFSGNCLREGRSLLAGIARRLDQGACDTAWESQSMDAMMLQSTNPTDTTTTYGTGPIFTGKDTCLEFKLNTFMSGISVTTGTCNGGLSQAYTLLQTEDGQFLIRVEHSKQCLARANNRVVQQPCERESPSMLWDIRGDGDARDIQLVETGQCLSVVRFSFFGIFFFGQQVSFQDCSGNTSLWKIPALGTEDPEWDGPFGTPLVAVGAMNLPDGKIMLFSSGWKNNFLFTSNYRRTYTGIFDPVTHQTVEQLVAHTDHDMFCPSMSMMDDGRYLITGGTDDKAVTIYDPVDNIWSKAPELLVTRGYHTSSTLPDGSIFTVGGSWVFGNSTRGGKVGEMYHPETSTWELTPGIESEPMSTADLLGPYRADNHMWLFHAPNGLVFLAGPAKQMFWIDPYSDRYWKSVKRGDDEDSMKGNAVMFDVGKILKLGGALNYDNTMANNRAYVIDINGDEAIVRRVGDMNFPRGMVNSVVLPNGKVAAFGGCQINRVFSDYLNVLHADIWDPATGDFTLSAEPMKVARCYHSVALLQKDGRVMVGGGGLCGNCRANHPDVEIFTPDYLRGSPTRPVIVSAPERVLPGDTIRVEMDAMDPDMTFAMMRFASVTHATNTDQRRVPLKVVGHADNVLELQVPKNPNVAIYGYYYLFAMNGNGVPSEGFTTFCERPGRRRQRRTLQAVPTCSYAEDCTGDSCCGVDIERRPDENCQFHGCYLWDASTNQQIALLEPDTIHEYPMSGGNYTIQCDSNVAKVHFAFGETKSMDDSSTDSGHRILRSDYLTSRCGRKEVQVSGYNAHLPCFARQYMLEAECTL